MAVETDSDRAIFFSTDDFGVVATITPNVGSAFGVAGIYDAVPSTRGVRQDNGYNNQGDITGSVPVFRTTSAAMGGVRVGTISIPAHPALPNGGVFSMWDVKHDGTGHVAIALKKA